MDFKRVIVKRERLPVESTHRRDKGPMELTLSCGHTKKVPDSLNPKSDRTKCTKCEIAYKRLLK